MSPAITEADYGWAPDQVQVTLRSQGSGYVLDGTKLFVPDADGATHFLVAARSDGNVRFALVDATAPGVTHRRLPGLLDWQAEVVFTNVAVGPDNVLGDGASDSWVAFADVLDRDRVPTATDRHEVKR